MTDTPSPLATLEDVAAATKSTTAADPTDLALVNALTLASGLVRDYTGQLFDLVEGDVVKLSGTGTHHIQLPQVPVVDVATVDIYDDTDVLVTPPDTYLTRLDSRAGLVHRIDDIWAIGYMNITVTYSHGFIMPGESYDGPLDVQYLPGVVRTTTASIAAQLWALDPTGELQSESIGNYSIGYSRGSGGIAELEQVLRVLWPFRVVDAA